jgi:hypothetical protein
MKEVRAAAAKATRNFHDDKLTIGLDLGDAIQLVLRVGTRRVRCCWNRGRAQPRTP